MMKGNVLMRDKSKSFKKESKSVLGYGDSSRVFHQNSEDVALKAAYLAKKAGKKQITKKEVEKALKWLKS